MQGPQQDFNQLWGNSRDHQLMNQSMHIADFKPQSAGWAAEFSHSPSPQVSSPPSTQIGAMHTPSYMPTMSSRLGMAPMLNYGSQPMLTTTDKGKGKSREIDFDAAFAQFDQHHGPSAQETARIEELDDTADLAAAMGGTSLQDDGETDFKQ